MFDKTLVRLSNLATRLRRPRCRPEELLVLASRCLQRSDCDCKVVEDVRNCAACGRCAMAGLKRLADEYGIEVYVATGGRLALERARQPHIRAIVAVACHAELREGIFAALPKAVLATAIGWPCGPCKDTTVAMEEVEEAVQWFLR